MGDGVGNSRVGGGGDNFPIPGVKAPDSKTPLEGLVVSQLPSRPWFDSHPARAGKAADVEPANVAGASQASAAPESLGGAPTEPRPDLAATMNSHGGRATVVCAGCGSEARAGGFCEQCGQPLSPSRGLCDRCGSALRAGVRFCTQCAAPVQ